VCSSDLQHREHRNAKWLTNIKNSKCGKGRGKLYPSLEKRLNEAFGVDWWKNHDLEQNSLKRCEEYITHFNELGRHPKQCFNNKKKRELATEEQHREHRNATWINTMKLSKQGKGNWNLYLSVENRLIKEFGVDWWITRKYSPLSL
jgi:hypothetical protein